MSACRKAGLNYTSIMIELTEIGQV